MKVGMGVPSSILGSSVYCASSTMTGPSSSCAVIGLLSLNSAVEVSMSSVTGFMPLRNSSRVMSAMGSRMALSSAWPEAPPVFQLLNQSESPPLKRSHSCDHRKNSATMLAPYLYPTIKCGDSSLSSGLIVIPQKKLSVKVPRKETEAMPLRPTPIERNGAKMMVSVRPVLV